MNSQKPRTAGRMTLVATSGAQGPRGMPHAPNRAGSELQVTEQHADTEQILGRPVRSGPFTSQASKFLFEFARVPRGHKRQPAW